MKNAVGYVKKILITENIFFTFSLFRIKKTGRKDVPANDVSVLGDPRKQKYLLEVWFEFKKKNQTFFFQILYS